jgi:KDO2-lipid IV(A) lauroyltransferase
MARHSAIVNWMQYLALRGVAGFVQCFDLRQNLHTAESVGSAFCALSAGRRRRAERNIARSFPDWPMERVRTVARRSMQHMFRLFLVESFAAPRLITPTTWSNYVRFSAVGPLMDLLLRNEPAIFITGHCGNWELLGSAMAAIGYPFVALARPLDNPLINDWLLNIREARGMRIIAKWGATPVLQDALRNGGRIAFIADQNAGDQGLFVPFFGRLASTYKSIGLLAMRYNVPVIAGCALRSGSGFQYEISYTDFIRPEDWAEQPDPLFYITARFSRAIELMITQAPDQYLWLHRRWKSRPRHEREGKPMPDRLIAKLRLSSIELAMRAEGAQTAKAIDGSAAVLACQSTHPDAVILDMMLPKASGFVVLEKIMEHPAPPVVVMITANQGKRHMVYAQNMGVHAYMTKPVALKRLVDTIVSLLETRDDQDEGEEDDEE